MTSTINAAVLTYLKEHYPDVAHVFEQEAYISKPPFLPNDTTVETLIASQQRGVKHRLDYPSSDGEKPSRKECRTELNAAVPDSSSDDDDAPVRKPAQKAKASPAMRPAPKKTPRSECCGEQEPVKKSVRTEVVSAGPGGKEWEDNNVNNTGKSNGNGGTALRRFQRIDPTKVVFVKDELRDNRPGGEHMAFRQNQEMMRVKGKNFNKLKQKNKAKFYAAGVDTSVRSFQFDDSD